MLAIMGLFGLGVIVAGFKAWGWMQKWLTGNIVSGMQGLVDRMKEYDLDASAGLLICSGADLQIRYMDISLEPLLGSPRCVDDILPPSMRAKHRVTVARFVGSKPLPDSLNHPLRNVQILTKDQGTIHAKVIIGKFQFFSQLVLRDIFYVVIQPCNCSMRTFKKSMTNLTSTRSRSTSFASDLALESCPVDSIFSNAISSKSPKEYCTPTAGSQNNFMKEFELPSASFESEERDELQGMVEVYGLGAASYIGRGLVPATERYSQATVLYVDIVDFTRHCMVKGLDEISGWMTRIHSAIDELLEKHAIRKVETRGDCCICVSGTNFVGGEHGSSRDLSSTQATRMLSFGHDLGLALSAIEGTEVRMGMATGSVVLTHISHGGDALPAKYIYGDTVNVACRMEQTGRVGAVQLCESAARAYAEERSVAVPPLATRQVKGKGAMKTVFYSYVDDIFVCPEREGGQAGSGPARPEGRSDSPLIP